jgi:hypothetical protein
MDAYTFVSMVNMLFFILFVMGVFFAFVYLVKATLFIGNKILGIFIKENRNA